MSEQKQNSMLEAFKSLQQILDTVKLQNVHLNEDALLKKFLTTQNPGLLDYFALEIYRLQYRGATLSDLEIISELGKDVIIYPFNKIQLQPSTYDITLGEFYFRRNPHPKFKYLHPENGSHIIDYWNVIPDKLLNYGAHQATEVKTQEEADEYGVKVGDKVIILKPGELILAHTQEFIGGRNSITTEIKCRSTFGRSGITICKCSGQGDNGYINRWTLEIQNHTQTNIVLTVGERVGHIKFLRTGLVEIQYEKKGNYQSTDNLDTLRKEWTALCLIPSAGAKLIREIEKK